MEQQQQQQQQLENLRDELSELPIMSNDNYGLLRQLRRATSSPDSVLRN
jgi:hypothetical protein